MICQKYGRLFATHSFTNSTKRQKRNPVDATSASAAPNRTTVQENETQAAVDSIILVKEVEKPKTNIRTYARKTDWSRQY